MNTGFDLKKFVLSIVFLFLLSTLNAGAKEKAKKVTHISKDVLESAIDSENDIKIVKIIVDQKYKRLNNFSLPIYELTKVFFEGAGFSVAGSGHNIYDGILYVKSSGTPIGKKYGKDQYLYTGAELRGSTQFTIGEWIVYTEEYQWRQDPPFLFHLFGSKKEIAQKIEKLKKPVNAPLLDLFEKNFHIVLGNILYKLWGIKALESILKTNKSWNICKKVIAALGKTKDVDAIKPLINYRGGGVNVSLTIYRALLQLNNENAVQKALVRALKDDNYRTRHSAASLLGYMEPKIAVDPLIRTLKDEKCFVRSQAVESLGKIRDPRSVEPIIKGLKDDCQSMRFRSAVVLGKIKDWKAIGPLIVALSDNDEQVRKRVAEALRKITGQKLGTKKELWEKWWLENKDKLNHAK